MMFVRPFWKPSRFALILALLGFALVGAQACGPRQGGNAAYNAQGQHPAHGEWARRLQGTWQRVDGQNDPYEAGGASQLRIDDQRIEQGYRDGRQEENRWAAVQADKDVVHVAVQMPNKSAEVWRLYLYSPQELVVFAPGLPPATYRRGGAEDAELSPQTQQANSGASASSSQEQMKREAQELLGHAPDDAPQENAPNVQHLDPEDLPDSIDPDALATEAPSAPTSTAQSAQPLEIQHDGKPSPEELRAIYQQIQSVQDTMSDEDRALGERLLRGAWELTDESIEQVNHYAGENGVEFTGIVLKFGDQDRLSMVWKTVDETLSNGATWSIEGMYGAELRVILTEPNQEPNRERLEFVDANHFILDPGGEHMIFERRAQ